MAKVSETTAVLVRLAKRAGSLAVDTDWFLFGSALENPDGADDVDLLIVYDDRGLERALRLLDFLTERGPATLDVVLLSSSEEQQIGFIGAQQAEHVWPAGSARALAGAEIPTP